MLITALLLLSCSSGLSWGRTLVGDLTETDHNVAGKVYIVDEDTLLIDNFRYDGKGFGVYINVATTGSNKAQFAANRIDIPYPTGSKGESIERKYNGDEQLVLDLKQVGVKAKDIKWLSVWCTVFQMSFGHVLF